VTFVDRQAAFEENRAGFFQPRDGIVEIDAPPVLSFNVMTLGAIGVDNGRLRLNEVGDAVDVHISRSVRDAPSAEVTEDAPSAEVTEKAFRSPANRPG
jgi:hypothetical protein